MEVRLLSRGVQPSCFLPRGVSPPRIEGAAQGLPEKSRIVARRLESLPAAIDRGVVFQIPADRLDERAEVGLPPRRLSRRRGEGVGRLLFIRQKIERRFNIFIFEGDPVDLPAPKRIGRLMAKMMVP